MANMEHQAAPAPSGGKTWEDYRLRYEDQSLKAFESHCAAAGNTVLVAYLLWKAPASLKLPEGELWGVALMAAAYAYLTYNVHVVGSLAKRLYKNADRIKGRKPTARVLQADSTRLLQPGPLGPLQLVVTRIAKHIARKKPRPVPFVFLIGLLIAVVLLVIGLMLAPLALKTWELTPLWPGHLRIVLQIIVLSGPLYQVTRLFFRFCRPYILELSAHARTLARPWLVGVVQAASDYFDQRGLGADADG
jgi:hypothetical protein